MKDLFSSDSNDYARYRPQYPPALFEFIYSKLNAFDKAWDCGTGNGQAAVELAKRFTHVYATDVSAEQLSQAAGTNNIAYAKESAESTSLADASVDLITVAQALHWLPLPAFYQEVARAAKKDALLAAWTYNLLSIDEHADACIHNFYFQTLKGYWDAERTYVDQGYANLPFPFSEIECPLFYIETRWSLEDLIGYINTWSGVKKFISANQMNPTQKLFSDMEKTWELKKIKIIKFPLHLKLAKVSTFQE